MNGAPTPEDTVNACLELAFATTLEAVLQHHCTATEAARVRLCLDNPSELLEALRADAMDGLCDALNEGLSDLINAVLYPDDLSLFLWRMKADAVQLALF